MFGGLFEVALTSKELFVSTYESPNLLSNQLLPITHSSFIVVIFLGFAWHPLAICRFRLVPVSYS